MQLNKICLSTIIAVGTLMMPSAVYAQIQGCAKVTVDTLKVRTAPSQAGKIITLLDKNDELKVTNEKDGWYEVILEDSSKGFVSSEFMSFTKAAGQINDNSVRIRNYPTTDNSKSEVFATLTKGEEVIIEAVVVDWYKVKTTQYEGYVFKDYVTPNARLKSVKAQTYAQAEKIESKIEVEQTITTASTKLASSNTNKKSAPKVASASSAGAAIAADAKQFVGTAYVYGGNSLSSGVDCSGFVQQIMKRHGVGVSRSSRSQYAGDGYNVSYDQLSSGDLVFFGYDGVVSHVGIYIGNGKMVHASDSNTGVIVSNVQSNSKPYIGAKRVI